MLKSSSRGSPSEPIGGDRESDLGEAPFFSGNSGGHFVHELEVSLLC